MSIKKKSCQVLPEEGTTYLIRKVEVIIYSLFLNAQYVPGLIPCTYKRAKNKTPLTLCSCFMKFAFREKVNNHKQIYTCTHMHAYTMVLFYKLLRTLRENKGRK